MMAVRRLRGRRSACPPLPLSGAPDGFVASELEIDAAITSNTFAGYSDTSAGILEVDEYCYAVVLTDGQDGSQMPRDAAQVIFAARLCSRRLTVM